MNGIFSSVVHKENNIFVYWLNEKQEIIQIYK